VKYPLEVNLSPIQHQQRQLRALHILIVGLSVVNDPSWSIYIFYGLLSNFDIDGHLVDRWTPLDSIPDLEFTPLFVNRFHRLHVPNHGTD
jgi:hypothetical protein